MQANAQSADHGSGSMTEQQDRTIRALVEQCGALREDVQRWRLVAALVAGVLVVVIALATLNGCQGAPSSGASTVEGLGSVVIGEDGSEKAQALRYANETAADVVIRCSRPDGCEYLDVAGRTWVVEDVRRWRGREDVVELEVGGLRSPFGVHASRFHLITTRAAVDTTVAGVQ